jgi:hypothetical protein
LTASAKKSIHHKQEPLARRGSFSELSLFAKKSSKDEHCAVDDIGFSLNEKPFASF